MTQPSKQITLNEYQERAMTTCMPASENFSYMFLNLVGEIGELSSKIAKAIRKDQLTIDRNKIYCQLGHEFETGLKAEAGDILWQLAGLCHSLGWTLNEIGQANLDKLASRQERGVIDGNGDFR